MTFQWNQKWTTAAVILAIIIAAVLMVVFVPALVHIRLWFVPAYWDMRSDVRTKTLPGRYYRMFASENGQKYSGLFNQWSEAGCDESMREYCEKNGIGKCRVLETGMMPVI